MIISDRYILTNRNGQQINHNLIPLLNTILNTSSEELNVSIFTYDLNPIRNEPEKIKEKAKKAYRRLKASTNNSNINYRIISSYGHGINLDLHDRIILTNYITIDSGKGFNLLPWSTSTSQIIVDSIFNKYTYNRLKNLKKCFNNYITNLEGIETLNFRYYPE